MPRQFDVVIERDEEGYYVASCLLYTSLGLPAQK